MRVIAVIIIFLTQNVIAQTIDEPGAGFSTSLSYTADAFGHNSCAKQLHLFHLVKPGMQWAAGSSSWLSGASFELQLLGVFDHNAPFEHAPEQGISNIAAENMFKVFLLGISKEFTSAGLGVYFGLYDFNAEFDVRNTSQFFINPSHGIGIDIAQSGLCGPSIFPNSALSLRLRKILSPEMRLLMAVVDAAPGTHAHPDEFAVKLNRKDGYILASELQWFSDGLEDNIPGFAKFSAGGWYYTGTNYDDNQTAQDHNFGLYSSIEKHFSSAWLFTGTSSCFLRAGVANTRVNTFSGYGGAGFVIYPATQDAVVQNIGYSVACGRVSETYREANTGINTFELIHELSILLKVTDFMHLQPDFQYVVHPLGGMDAMIFTGCRLNLEF